MDDPNVLLVLLVELPDTKHSLQEHNMLSWNCLIRSSNDQSFKLMAKDKCSNLAQQFESRKVCENLFMKKKRRADHIS